MVNWSIICISSYFHFFILFLFIHLQALTNNVNEKQLDELHASAKPLIHTCGPDLVKKINETVKAAECEWKDTNNNLRNLKDKYERAIDLWNKYRDSSNVIKNWAADRMDKINVLKPLDENTIEVIITFFYEITNVFIIRKLLEFILLILLKAYLLRYRF